MERQMTLMFVIMTCATLVGAWIYNKIMPKKRITFKPGKSGLKNLKGGLIIQPRIKR